MPYLEARAQLQINGWEYFNYKTPDRQQRLEKCVDRLSSNYCTLTETGMQPGKDTGCSVKKLDQPHDEGLTPYGTIKESLETHHLSLYSAPEEKLSQYDSLKRSINEDDCANVKRVQESTLQAAPKLLWTMKPLIDKLYQAALNGTDEAHYAGINGSSKYSVITGFFRKRNAAGAKRDEDSAAIGD